MTLDSARDMLATAGMGEQAGIYGWVAVLMSVFGLLLGLALDNLPAALVIAMGLGASPLVVIRIRTADYLRSLHEKLESAMGIITNGYVSSGDFIGAVERSIHLLPALLPVRIGRMEIDVYGIASIGAGWSM